MKKIVIRVVTILLSLVMAGILFIYLSPDYHMYLVRSESMKPAINMGDMVLSRTVDEQSVGEITEGEIITYQRGEELITHRVVAIDGDTITTKGDAVEDPDAFPVSTEMVRAVVLFRIPGLGYISNFIQTKVGWFTMIVIPAVILLVLLFKSINNELKNRARNKEKAQDKGVISEEDYVEKTWRHERGRYLK